MQRSRLRPFMPNYLTTFYILKTPLYQIFKDQYIKVYPLDGNCPPVRFYGLPKIHKGNTIFRPTASACGTSTYKFAKFQIEIL